MNRIVVKLMKSLLFCFVLSPMLLLYGTFDRDHQTSKIKQKFAIWKSDRGIKKVINSVWISYFPHLKNAVYSNTQKTFEPITDAKYTVIEVENGRKNQYNIGDTVHAKISAFDFDGRRKKIGGDFFEVILRRPDSQIDGISCPVEDHSDGIYTVQCLLPWEGEALLTCTLIHPSLSLLQMMLLYSSEKHYGLNIMTKMLNSQNETEDSICAIGFPDTSSDKLCDYSNPTHGEKRNCLKPPSGECSKIIDQAVQEDPTKTTLYDNLYFVKGFNFHAPIQGSGIKLKIRNNTAKKLKLQLNKEPSLDPMAPTGFWFNSTWISIKSENYVGIDQKSMRECVTNKRLYFFGDSTMRIIYKRILSVIKLNDTGLDNSVAWSRGRDAEDDKLNLTVQYRSHGPPLLNPGPEDSRPYMSDSLDAIKSGGKGTIVILTIGYHFQLLDPDVFLDRIRIIKSCVLDLISRLPGVKVVIKGLHYHSRDIADRMWLSYRLEILLRNEFIGLKGVDFIESWDYTMVYNNTALHPRGVIFDKMISNALTTIC